MNQPGRVMLASRLARRDVLHGAWWPASFDVVAELRTMLSHVLPRLHVVHGISLNREEWPGAPLMVDVLGNRGPTVTWYGLTEANLAVLRFNAHDRVSLLLLPPATPETVALPAMLMAASPGNCLTASETLARATEQARRNEVETASAERRLGSRPPAVRCRSAGSR